MKNGEPIDLPQRMVEDAYSIVSQYQSEYRGVVQYYRMAYNLHILSKLKHVAEVSLVKTLASKYRTTCPKIYKRFGTMIKTDEGDRKVILVKYERELKRSLVAYFGGISLKWNKWVNIDEQLPSSLWNNRSELVERLKAQECELCGSHQKIEVHHIRKLADLKRKGTTKTEWQKRMISRNRKTLIVCQKCHGAIHYGKYDGRKLSA